MAALTNVYEIRRAAKVLLDKAGVVEQLPTPVDDLVAAAGLIETSDYEITESRIRQMPRALRRLVLSAKRKVSGLIDRRERIIQVDSGLNIGRKKFVKLHEVSHDIFPWQRDLLVLADTAKTLSPSIKLLFEQEANQGAAELLFQLDFLSRIARDYPVDRTTPIILRDHFGSSIHAAFRNWVSTHSGCACGLVLDKAATGILTPTFKRYECVPTEKWTTEFGKNAFPNSMPVTEFSFLSSLMSTVPADIDTEWTLQDRNLESRAVRVQSFTNSYRHFVLVWVPERESLLARIRKTPQIVSPSVRPASSIF